MFGFPSSFPAFACFIILDLACGIDANHHGGPSHPRPTTTTIGPTTTTTQNLATCPYGNYLTDHFFLQKLDHFTPSDTRTYLQHYQVSTKFFNTSVERPVVFVVIGNEQPIATTWLCSSSFSVMIWAQPAGALVALLEHRFFGSTSLGLPDMETSNLVGLLSADQAIEDVHTFIPGLIAAQGLVNPKVIILGGSYGGSLTLWTRAKYPEQTIGAVATAPFFRLKVNNWENMEMYTKLYDLTSPTCAGNVHEAVTQILEAVKTPSGRATISQIFLITPALSSDPKDIQLFQMMCFWWLITGRVNLNNTCAVMDNSQNGTLTQMERAAKLSHQYTATWEYLSYPNGSIDSRYQSQMDWLHSTTMDGSKAATQRAWNWLICTNFGSALFYPTTGDPTFGDLVSLDFLYGFCIDAYGPPMSKHYINQQIAANQKRHGYAWDYRTSNTAAAVSTWDSCVGLLATVSFPDIHQNVFFSYKGFHQDEWLAAYPTRSPDVAVNIQKISDEIAYFISSA